MPTDSTRRSIEIDSDDQDKQDKQDKQEKQREMQEIARMISDLNEVRMRLDSVVRKLADTQRSDGDDTGAAETVEGFRVTLAAQLDRIREKLVARMPTHA